MSTPLPARPSSLGAHSRRIALFALLPLFALGCAKLSNTTSGTAPTITSFSPASNALGTSTQITVTGSGFSTATAVTICGLTVPSSSANSDNQVISDTDMVFDLPAVTTTGPLTVTGPGGTVTSAQNFIVVPTFSNISSGAVGSNVTVTGNGLLGVTGVTFNLPSSATTDAATILTASSTATALVITLPSDLTPGTLYDVTFSNDYGISYATGTYTPAS
jgi:hypothetical protein